MYVLIFVLLVLGHARTIYKVKTFGTCKQYPYLPITDKNTCETQATLLNWDDTSASMVSFSSYLPQGCFYLSETSNLRLYPGSSSNLCSEKYQCVCQISAPDCSLGINNHECLCEDAVCTTETGLVCKAEGTCEHAPMCIQGLNDNVCKCGTKDCTTMSGLKCNDETCEHAENCYNRDGTVENEKTCRCGIHDCSQAFGLYCHAESSTCRKQCPGGTFVNHLLECQACTEPGFYCPVGSTQSQTQFKCPAGRYGPVGGISSPEECRKCSEGRFSIISGITSNNHCTGRCPAGKYSSEIGLSSAEQCTGQCSAGKYSSSTGLVSDAECMGRCSPGKYSSYTGLTNSDQCFECPAGKYSSETGRTSASECLGRCSVGKYSEQTGLISNAQCKVCSVNKYQNEIGMSSCKGCPDNKVIADTSSAQKHDSIDDCKESISICMANEYVENNICKKCLQTYYCDGQSKIICPPGNYCPGDGSKIPCPMGKFGATSAEKTLNSCVECEEGTYQNVVGQTYCARGCPRGKYGNIKGAVSEKDGCLPCPKGHMCDDTAMNRANKCPLGSYQPDNGAETCFFCPKDTYSNLAAAIECIDCGKNKEGEFLRTSGLGANSFAQCQTLSKTCPITQRPNSLGECENCKPGFYANGKGTKCILCPIGYYQPNSAATNCEKCDAIRCNRLKGADDLSNTMPDEMKDNVHKHVEHIDTNPFPVAIMIVYSSLIACIVVIICSHRLCPMCFKNLDFMFSGDHIVPNTHARRIISTRLGASFTLSLPLVISIIAVFVFTSDNSLSQNGLVPIATAQIPQKEGLYGDIHIRYISESASEMQNCEQIKVNYKELNCSTHTNIIDAYKCQTSIICKINPPFGGMHSILLEFPDNLQRGMCSISPSMWNNTQYNITSAILSQKIIAGNNKLPSVISYDIIRSKTQSHTYKNASYGLQMTLRAINLITDDTGTDNGVHTVAIQLYSTENLFVRETLEKLGIVTQIGTVLTLTISALSGLRMVKLGMEHGIDNMIIKCCFTTPEDIANRMVIMEERVNDNQMLIRNPLNNRPKKQIILDPVSGKKYIYDPVTKESKWLEEHL